MAKSKSVPLVAIVGRTNVGKSTLFNALLRRRLAIVEDSPGVTRDRHYAYLQHFGFPMTLVDTGGLVGEDHLGSAEIQKAVNTQTRLAIDQSDLIMAVFDGIAGPHDLDKQVVKILRRSGKEIVWVINKCESTNVQAQSPEFYALGLKDLICVSAVHGAGIKELGKLIGQKLGIEAIEDSEQDDSADSRIKVAILGKPNVGKSSIVNRILGEERLVISDQPGTTRDSIDTALKRDGQEFVLIDTAGLRRKSKVPSSSIERFGNLRSLAALARCDVACLVLDGAAELTDQDKRIAQLIHERGRAMVLVVNKWDLVEKDHRTVKAYKDALRQTLPFISYAPVLFVSALSGRRCPSILGSAKRVQSAANQRIATSELNKILSRAFQVKTPPVVRGEPVKLFFATQIAAAPPTVVMFVSRPKDLPDSYQRYLKTQLRKHFAFEGSDIRIILRKRTEKEARKGRGADGPSTLAT
ncbi:MAG: ribosome biogenesis GTPase Der [Proteobacteria bacterium]|nr:MAG: ribosome biogenesis GTPase Der [Pseudomonadota bacterium]